MGVEEGVAIVDAEVDLSTLMTDVTSVVSRDITPMIAPTRAEGQDEGAGVAGHLDTQGNHEN